MRLLLDTHALLWMLQLSPRLSPRAIRLLGDGANELLVSPVSAYEFCLKHRQGKLPEATALALAFEKEIEGLALIHLPVTVAHAEMAGKLDLAHRDPFDRLLAAQSLIEHAPLVTNDPAFAHFGVERIW